MKKIYLSFFMLMMMYASFAQNDCATAVAIPSIPYSSGTLTTCGTGDDYAAGSYFNANYGNGEDYVFSVNITNAPVSYSVVLGGAAIWKIASVHTACPPTLGNSIGAATTSSGSTGSSVVNFPTNGTYYIFVDTWPTPACGEFTLDITVPPPMTYVSSTTTQSSTAAVVGGSINQQIVRLQVVAINGGSPLSVTNLDLNTNGTTNTADITAAKVYYTGTSTTFSTTTQFGSTVANPSGAYSVAGSQTLIGNATNTSNYFWVVYDLACAATAANLVDGEVTGVTVGGTPQVPTVTAPTGTRAITAASTTATTTQPSTAVVTAGTVDNQILRVQATSCAGSSVTAINFNTTGSTNPSTDITSAKVYFTTTTTFATTTQFGTAVTSPNGSFVVNGTQALVSGTGYFWLVYDVPASATDANLLDAGCESVVINGSPIVPATVNPAGTRAIATPPANDICGGAITIPSAGPFPYLTGATSNAAASNTNDPTNTCQTNANKGLWYTFTPDASGSFIISSCQSVAPLSTISDNVISIFSSATGCTGPFTQVACDDDACTTLANQAVVTTNLTAGTTYYILVYGYNTSVGNVQLHITAPVPCPVPTAVAVNTITSTSANVTWTGTGTYIVEYGATGFTPGTDGNAGVGGTVINPATSPQAITTGLTAGTAYQVYVRQDCSGAGNGYSGNSTVVAFTTLGTPPACTTNTLPVNGATNVDYAGGTTIAWNSVATATTYQVYFSDDDGVTYNLLGSTPNTSILITGLDPLSTYYFYIAPVASGSPAVGCIANATSFTTGALPAPPANDDCAASVTIGTTPISVTNIGATQTLAAQSCNGFTSPSAFDVWFQFTAVSNGAATVNVINTGIVLDPVIQVYSGTCAALGTPIGCADATVDGEDEVATLNGLVAGQTYFVRVYGWDGSAGTFDISVTGAALPISIEYFRGTKQNNRNVLDWKVSCYNSPSVTLTLERSADGRHFEGISTTTETAARCLQPFNYNDLAPLAGINYYRLKSIDIDGKITYSTIVALLNKDKGFELISLAPNPIHDEAILSVTSAEKAIMEIVVSDLNGKQISKQRISLIAGNNQVSLNLRNMAAGTYQVSGLTADGQVKSLRFVKQ